MDFVIDLDPTHQVLRTTVTAAVLTHELAGDCYRSLALIASRGGPYALIFDLSGATDTTMSTNEVRECWARRAPAVPGERIHVAVAKEPVIYGLCRLIELTRDAGKFQVVHSMEEAYEMVGVRSEDFTECIFPKRIAA